VKQIGFLIVAVHLSLFDQIASMVWTGAQRRFFGTKQSDACQAACAFWGKADHQDFQRRAVFAECAGRLFKNLRSTKWKISGALVSRAVLKILVCQPLTTTIAAAS